MFRPGQDRGDLSHAGREGAEGLLNALAIPDVRQHLLEDGQFAASPTGTCSPDYAIRVSRPTVFRVTVLPPVLGPVLTRERLSRLPSMYRFSSRQPRRTLWSKGTAPFVCREPAHPLSQTKGRGHDTPAEDGYKKAVERSTAYPSRYSGVLRPQSSTRGPQGRQGL